MPLKVFSYSEMIYFQIKTIDNHTMVQRYRANYPMLKGTLLLVQFTVINITNYEHINIIAVYCSPQVPQTQLCLALQHIVDHSSNNIFIGDFNANWLGEVQRQSLYGRTIVIDT